MPLGGTSLAEKPRILLIHSDRADDSAPVELLEQHCEVVSVSDPLLALTRLREGEFQGVYCTSGYLSTVTDLARLLQNEQVLEHMADGALLLDADTTIVWANRQICRWAECDDVVGMKFYAAIGTPEILGPDFSPFHTALSTGQPSTSSLRVGENRYYQLHASPLTNGESGPEYLVVTLRDVTDEVLQQQKLAAIHRAGMELADIKPEEVSQMVMEERIELLKANILHHTKDLLQFDVVEIRLLDVETHRLLPLLAVGMSETASSRDLRADPTRNGVTGFVAATGKSYLCEDTAEDPLYIEGAKGARSSLTVPLILHDEVIGTFNVESPERRAFTESDLQFLELFARDLAVSINTLELLVAEKANAAAQSVEAIHSAVAMPVDNILNDAVNVMERYIGHESDVEERLQRILQNARDIKQVIQKIGQNLAPTQAHPSSETTAQRPGLVGRRVLVVDEDESVRKAAHQLMERFGCIVESAHHGAEACSMVRSLRPGMTYDAIIADIRLPDMSGYELMVQLGEMLELVPLILMTGFGYDPGHAIVKARRAGLHPEAILYKPFRLDQLLNTVETIIANPVAIKQA